MRRRQQMESDTIQKARRIMGWKGFGTIIKNPADMEDIMQEASMAILINLRNRRKRFRKERGSFSTWTTTIFHNKKNDLLRRSYRSNSFHEKYLVAAKIESCGKPRLIQIFLLMTRDYNGKQISKVMGLSQGQISKDKSQIRKLLREYKPKEWGSQKKS